MTKTLFRGLCWLAIFAGIVMIVALAGTWTGLITGRGHARFFETRWYYDNPSDVPKIVAAAGLFLLLGGLGIRFVPRSRRQWVYPLWPERD